MKRTLSMIALAVLTIGLLGSCSKINERLDNLDKRVDGLENEQIASINSQITSISSSIADLGQIRSDISGLKQSAENHGQEIFDLMDADEILENRILTLQNYLDDVLPTFAETEWVKATFSTLEQYEATCDTIAKIDARVGALDAKLSKDIKACADSLTKWVNKTFEGYYTAAQMDAKLTQMKSDIDSARAANKITDAKADSIAAELTKTKTAVDTAKANIRTEYKAAVKSAIETSEGKLTKALQEEIATVNGKIEALTGKVTALETSVGVLTGRVDKLEEALGAYTELQGTIVDIIKKLLSEVGDKPQSEQDTTVWKCITALQAQCGTIGTAIETLQGLVGSKDVETRITEAIASLVSTQKLAGLADAVSALEDIVYGKGDEKSLTQQIADINAALTTTYVTKEQLGKDIETAKADLQHQVDSLCDVIGKETAETATGLYGKIAGLNAKVAALEAVSITIGTTTYTDWGEAVKAVLAKVDALGIGNIDGLQAALDALDARLDKIEAMIQSVTIVPAYSDGSVDAKAGFVTVNIIVEPASAVAALDKSCITVFVNTVKTKSVSLDTAKVVTLEKDTETGIVSILADVSDFTPESGNALAVAVNVKTGLSDYTTDFSPVTSTNVKVVVGGEGEPNQVLMTAKDPHAPKDVEGKIPVKGEDGKNTFDQSKPTVIKVVGIGTVTFDETAAATINENAAGADSIFFEVKDVTPGGKQEVVYQVLMKKKTAEGGDVFSVSNAAGEVTMEIPLASNVADVTKVTLLDVNDNPISGGVVYGSVIYDSENKIVTFKVNHFSKYAVGYILDDENYHKVTGISLDKSALELEKGTFKKLIATIKPDNASNKNVIWSSSDTSKVKVDTAGKVTAVALGTATVTATSMNNRSLTATCEVTVVELKSYVEIEAKYDGSTVSTLRWYRQSLAITDSGKKAWKGGSGSAVKVPGTGEDVVVGDYFQWGTFAGFYGSGADSDKGLLPYSSFTNTKCGDGSDAFTFKSGKQFNQTNAPYWSGSAYTKYNATDKKTELDASDDVASVILGGTWRMPTTKEFQALKEVTYWAWDATDKGYYVYTPNPASDAGKVNDGTGTYNKADALLFFPAAGNGYTDTYYDAGKLGDFWTGSLNSANPAKGCILYLNGEEGSIDAASNDSDRYRGYSVRPVQDPAAKYEAVTGVTFDVEKKEVVEGGNVQLSATVTPDDATNKGVYWTSSAPAVATVDATGKVTGVKAGPAIITATTVDGTMTASCTVTVKTPVTTFKAVYNTNGGANTLTFYYDAKDHSGEGITVYDNLPTAATGNTSWGYNGVRKEIKKVVITESVKNYSGLTSTAYMFQGMTAASDISGAEYLDVSNVTDMSLMFMNFGGGSTNSHTTLNSVPDVSKWNTANVKNMTGMFWDYGNFSDNLTKVPDVSNWNTANVTNMAGMFQQYGYSSINFNDVPKVSGWSTVSVEDMSTMFRYYGKNSTALTAVPDVCNWNTAEVKTMLEMFREYGASSTVLKAVPDVSGWNTGKVTNMKQMFNNYGSTSENISCVLDLSGWDLSKITGTNGDKVFSFTPKTFNVTIPAKTGEKSNEGGKWYYGDGTNYIAPPTGKTFTPTIAGALKGEFSVSATKKVRFSKGNLVATIDANGTPTAWKFATKQYDYLGEGGANKTIGVAAGSVDLFGWSTASTTYGISTSTSDKNYSGDFVDWGKAIDDKGTWSTLSEVEWKYLLNTRKVNGGTKEGKSYQRATINSDATSVYGMILYPDDYTSQTGATSYTSAEWTKMEQDDCVFLPAAGTRKGSVVDGVGGGGFWSSTACEEEAAYLAVFTDGRTPYVPDDDRNLGYSVRLVTEVK